jgi:hypothetical protein
MKRPRWATAVGILGMIIAFFGITASGQMLTMPKMIKLQHQIMHDMEASLKGKPKIKRSSGRCRMSSIRS